MIIQTKFSSEFSQYTIGDFKKAEVLNQPSAASYSNCACTGADC